MIKPSEMLEFKEALSGGRGEFDAWLEVRNEAECREFIKQAIRDVLEEAAKVADETHPHDFAFIGSAIRKLKEDIQ